MLAVHNGIACSSAGSHMNSVIAGGGNSYQPRPLKIRGGGAAVAAKMREKGFTLSLWVLLNVVVNVAASLSLSSSYTNTWAVQIRGGTREATDLAQENGFVNLGKVSTTCTVLYDMIGQCNRLVVWKISTTSEVLTVQLRELKLNMFS